MMKQKQFLDTLWLAFNQKTIYAKGACGAPLTAAAKKRYGVSAPVDPSVFLFDCIGLIKAVLGGWCASDEVYGGTWVHKVDDKNVYGEMNVPDYNETGIFNLCSGISTDFSHIEPCEAVWMTGHIGVYVGAGLVIECTPAFSGGVQLTACNRKIDGFDSRTWLKHGKLPWVEYGTYTEPVITYQTFDLPRKKYLPLVTNLTDYAGIFGEAASAVRATPSVGKFEYWTKVDPDQWLGGTYNGSQSGILTKPIIALMCRYDQSRAHYRVHAGGKWLGVISGCDPGDLKKGYAGDDKNAIDAVYLWADPIFEEEKPTTPENPAQGEEKPSEPTNDTHETEKPAESENTASGGVQKKQVPEWFFNLVQEFYLKFIDEYEKNYENEKENEK